MKVEASSCTPGWIDVDDRSLEELVDQEREAEDSSLDEKGLRSSLENLQGGSLENFQADSPESLQSSFGTFQMGRLGQMGCNVTVEEEVEDRGGDSRVDQR